MKKLKIITEDEMIVVFLEAELSSSRFKSTILSLLEKHTATSSLIETPDLEDEKENSVRKEILKDYRGFDNNESLFESFPTEVDWWRVILSREELSNVKYMQYSYWDTLSQHTRLPVKAVETIRKGVEIFNQSNDLFYEVANDFKFHKKFLPLILVSTDEKSDLCVLEGHLRLTSMFLSDNIQYETEVIVGFSPQMSNWNAY